MPNTPTASNPIHPLLRAMAETAQKKPGLAEMTAEQARAGMAARTAIRPKGPEISKVFDLQIPGPHGEIPLRIYIPNAPLGVALVF